MIAGRRLALDLRRFCGGYAVRFTCPGAEIDQLAPLRAKRAPVLGLGPLDTRAATGTGDPARLHRLPDVVNESETVAIEYIRFLPAKCGAVGPIASAGR